MQRYLAFVVYCWAILILTIVPAFAQMQRQTKEHRILIILNGNATMLAANATGETRFAQAAALITHLIEEGYAVNDQLAFGLRLFGHQFDDACTDTRKEVPFSKDNLAQVSLRLRDLSARGRGSAGNAITQAMQKDIVDTSLYIYSLILITDSSRTCKTDICHALQSAGKGVFFKSFLLDISGTIASENYPCFKVFPVATQYAEDTAISEIVRLYKTRIKRTESLSEYKTKLPQSNYTSTPTKSLSKPVIKDTVRMSAVHDTNVHAEHEAAPVQIRKSSKITTKEAASFGYANLINIGDIGRILIYKNENNQYRETNDIYPIGVNRMKVKLESGSYKLLYNAGFERTQLFEVKNDMITDVWVR